MIINNKNGMIINSKDIYLHDDYLLELHFFQNSRHLILDFQTFLDKTKYQIVFNNVIGIEMTAFDFWGELYPIRILDFNYVSLEKRKLIPILIEKKKSFNNLIKIDEKDFIEVAFTFVTGDTLIIACQEILYEK